MKLNAENISNNFLEFASEQRLNIMLNLAEKKLNISKLAEILDATKPEVHRNIGRLIKVGVIEKESDGNFILTTYGKTILVQIPSLSFISENKEYFETHSLGNLETKFIQRLGALHDQKQIKGFVKVLEKWKKIHENAEKYIYNILSEVPYSSDIINIISSQLENNVKIQSIFSENAIIPDERKEIFQKAGFQKYITNNLLERKIMKVVSISVLVTDKEAGVFFTNNQGVPDLSIMFTSENADFHEWCLDYFECCWKNASSFQESKLKE
jgi:predicted transcriptional regulator